MKEASVEYKSLLRESASFILGSDDLFDLRIYALDSFTDIHLFLVINHFSIYVYCMYQTKKTIV